MKHQAGKLKINVRKAQDRLGGMGFLSALLQSVHNGIDALATQIFVIFDKDAVRILDNGHGILYQVNTDAETCFELFSHQDEVNDRFNAPDWLFNEYGDFYSGISFLYMMLGGGISFKKTKSYQVFLEFLSKNNWNPTLLKNPFAHVGMYGVGLYELIGACEKLTIKSKPVDILRSIANQSKKVGCVEISRDDFSYLIYECHEELVNITEPKTSDGFVLPHGTEIFLQGIPKYDINQIVNKISGEMSEVLADGKISITVVAKEKTSWKRISVKAIKRIGRPLYSTTVIHGDLKAEVQLGTVHKEKQIPPHFVFRGVNGDPLSKYPEFFSALAWDNPHLVGTVHLIAPDNIADQVMSTDKKSPNLSGKQRRTLHVLLEKVAALSNEFEPLLQARRIEQQEKHWQKARSALETALNQAIKDSRLHELLVFSKTNSLGLSKTQKQESGKKTKKDPRTSIFILDEHNNHYPNPEIAVTLRRNGETQFTKFSKGGFVNLEILEPDRYSAEIHLPEELELLSGQKKQSFDITSNSRRTIVKFFVKTGKDAPIVANKLISAPRIEFEFMGESGHFYDLERLEKDRVLILNIEREEIDSHFKRPEKDGWMFISQILAEALFAFAYQELEIDIVIKTWKLEFTIKLSEILPIVWES